MTAAKPKAGPAEPMCVVHIGFEVALVMSVTKGMALVKLLSSGVAVTDAYGIHHQGTCEVRPMPRVSFRTVSADELTDGTRRITSPALLPPPSKEMY